MVTLKHVKFDCVSQFVDEAERDGSSIVNRTDTSWYHICAYDVVVGCLGLQQQSKTVVQIRGVYVMPCARGRGVGSKATDLAIAKARQHGCAVEATAYHWQWYVCRGFTVKRRYKRGAKVRLESGRI